MSFYSEFFCYRPFQPTRVTLESLADFLSAFEKTGASMEDGLLYADLKLDDVPSRADAKRAPVPQVPVPDTDPHENDQWTRSQQFGSLSEIISFVKSCSGDVRAAAFGLGFTAPSLCDKISRPSSSENDVPLVLDAWHLAVGPVWCASLDHTFRVGGMSAGVSGLGYLYPWTPADLVKTATKCREFQQLLALCRAVWPVEPIPPDSETRRGRQLMGELWPYDDLDLPLDWYWGVHETG